MPTAIWKKLNQKEEVSIVVWNPPESFESDIASLSNVRIDREFSSAADHRFAIAFVTKRYEIDRVAANLPKLAEGDVIVWVCYPKGSSKRYTCDFRRDSGWEPLGASGFEAVRQVAIDEDWSAVRFRRVEYIKKMKRDPKRALTQEGKANSNQ